MKANCDCCANYVYDEEFDYYICLIDLDQDEMERFTSFATAGCPYFRYDDDHTLASRQ